MKKENTPNELFEGAWETFDKKTRYHTNGRLVALCIGTAIDIGFSNLTLPYFLHLKEDTCAFLAFTILVICQLCCVAVPMVIHIFIVEKIKRRKIERDEKWQKAYLDSKI